MALVKTMVFIHLSRETKFYVLRGWPKKMSFHESKVLSLKIICRENSK